MDNVLGIKLWQLQWNMSFWNENDGKLSFEIQLKIAFLPLNNGSKKCLDKTLILNVAYDDWVTKKIFHSRLPKTAFSSIFYLFILLKNIILYQKTFIKNYCIKKLCKKSLENINQIMRNSTYMQKRIIYASIKTLQINLWPSSAAN